MGSLAAAYGYSVLQRDSYRVGGQICLVLTLLSSFAPTATTSILHLRVALAVLMVHFLVLHLHTYSSIHTVNILQRLSSLLAVPMYLQELSPLVIHLSTRISTVAKEDQRHGSTYQKYTVLKSANGLKAALAWDGYV